MSVLSSALSTPPGGPVAERLRVACVQVCARNDVKENVADTLAWIRQAALGGAQLIALPEAVDYLDADFQRTRDYARVPSEHFALAAYKAAALDLGCWILVGSITTRHTDGELVNRSMLISPQGEVVCHYDKIHLFDALPGSSSFTESNLYKRGARAQLWDGPWGRLGFSICYDVRFAQLYRALAQAGANLIAVPAAFMKITGEAHWHTLLRARAIETGCYVIAPAQCGHHYGGRYSYGHSLIVDPWGEILADGGLAPGIVMADIDPARVDWARTSIPSLGQDRSFDVQVGA
ncbi:carbon-nitrogen hydrolase family protein [Pandoraea sp. PE-S2T-3]|uniref:carbon-nitrogen hydrolase family protein n=1 Tax=Pandoraea sp. PE-S2T-3 TaxID=1986993 RepID=UPI000B3F9368|nr:carbon-nitrogen hydrolase family protein [Pandoraea sp. PE-S2T-3]